MSQTDPYGVANPTVKDPQFLGEMPLPESIYANDPGISNHKANADHSHGINLGGVDTPWSNLLLISPVVIYGGGYRPPQYSRLGNLVFVRGVVNCSGNPGGFALHIGTLPSEYRPREYSELGLGFGGLPQNAYRIDFDTMGRVLLAAGPAANPTYLSLGAPTSIICID